MSLSVISIDPETMGGTPVFRGTRVHIQTLFDYLGGGDSIDFFLENYPSVSRSQAYAVIGLAAEAMLAPFLISSDAAAA